MSRVRAGSSAVCKRLQCRVQAVVPCASGYSAVCRRLQCRVQAVVPCASSSAVCRTSSVCKTPYLDGKFLYTQSCAKKGGVACSRVQLVNNRALGIFAHRYIYLLHGCVITSMQECMISNYTLLDVFFLHPPSGYSALSSYRLVIQMTLL